MNGVRNSLSDSKRVPHADRAAALDEESRSISRSRSGAPAFSPAGREKRCIMGGSAKMYQNLFMNSLDSEPESRYLIPFRRFGWIKFSSLLEGEFIGERLLESGAGAEKEEQELQNKPVRRKAYRQCTAERPWSWIAS